MSYSIAIHGGAGTITRQTITSAQETAYTSSLKAALESGIEILKEGGSAVDAVSNAVVLLENDPLFNAGKGSVYTAEGKHEMDAAIMDGSTLKAGAVSGVTQIKNPILLARAVMEKSPHVFLYGEGAEMFAQMHGIPFEDPDWFHTEFRYAQLLEAMAEGKAQLDHNGVKDKKFGTVGAVAKDQHGNLAAATSTGGMTYKRFNRIGDSPLIGAGTYANNNTCAVSCTGHGEYFIRAVVAYDISCLMEYKGLSLEEACRIVVNEKLVKIGGEGGLIAVDSKGNIALPFNCEGMYRGWYSEDMKKAEVGIYK